MMESVERIHRSIYTSFKAYEDPPKDLIEVQRRLKGLIVGYYITKKGEVLTSLWYQ